MKVSVPGLRTGSGSSRHTKRVRCTGALRGQAAQWKRHVDLPGLPQGGLSARAARPSLGAQGCGRASVTHLAAGPPPAHGRGGLSVRAPHPAPSKHASLLCGQAAVAGTCRAVQRRSAHVTRLPASGAHHTSHADTPPDPSFECSSPKAHCHQAACVHVGPCMLPLATLAVHEVAHCTLTASPRASERTPPTAPPAHACAPTPACVKNQSTPDLHPHALHQLPATLAPAGAPSSARSLQQRHCLHCPRRQKQLSPRQLVAPCVGRWQACAPQARTTLCSNTCKVAIKHASCARGAAVGAWAAC